MKKFSFLLLVCLAGGVPVQAAALDAPGPVIVAGENDADWRALFAALASQGGVFSTFTEQRWFSVRKKPVVLQGELRHSAALGLSLRYTGPEEQMMIVDAQGILLRNARGRSRALETDPRAPGIDTALLQVLRFDEPALLRLFELHAVRDAAAWRLDFVARSPELARALGQITVQGEGEEVRRLEFRRGAGQRVEVAIKETRTGVTFTDEDRRRFFR